MALALQIPNASGQARPSPTAAAAPQRAVVYVNRKYGFRFYLPQSWVGYTIIEDAWHPKDGGMIRIRHPLWTEENPREDIPIMILTRQQWRDVQRGKLGVDASPFPPGELGRNRRFVFVVTSRWYYDFADGWEEAQKILGNGLRAF